MRNLQAALLASGLLVAPWLFEPIQTSGLMPGTQSVAMPGWTQTLKGQTIVENPGRSRWSFGKG